MKTRKLLRILHRDFGYFIAGMTVLYALSGIFFNHRHDLNPNYKILVTEFQFDKNLGIDAGEDEIKSILEPLDKRIVYKEHYLNSQGLIKVFIENGEIVINTGEGRGTMHYLQKRPIIFEMNKLHKAKAGELWKWTSDILATILIFVAASGLFLLKGKRGLTRWGWWLVVAGVAVPLFFVVVNI